VKFAGRGAEATVVAHRRPRGGPRTSGPEGQDRADDDRRQSDERNAPSRPQLPPAPGQRGDHRLTRRGARRQQRRQQRRPDRDRDDRQQLQRAYVERPEQRPRDALEDGPRDDHRDDAGEHTDEAGSQPEDAGPPQHDPPDVARIGTGGREQREIASLAAGAHREGSTRQQDDLERRETDDHDDHPDNRRVDRWFVAGLRRMHHPGPRDDAEADRVERLDHVEVPRAGREIDEPRVVGPIEAIRRRRQPRR
jgi:hypothetical protein